MSIIKVASIEITREKNECAEVTDKLTFQYVLHLAIRALRYLFTPRRHVFVEAVSTKVLSYGNKKCGRRPFAFDWPNARTSLVNGNQKIWKGVSLSVPVGDGSVSSPFCVSSVHGGVSHQGPLHYSANGFCFSRFANATERGTVHVHDMHAWF